MYGKAARSIRSRYTLHPNMANREHLDVGPAGSRVFEEVETSGPQHAPDLREANLRGGRT
jgi:hypothetical protein